MTCVECGHDMVPQPQFAAAVAAGRDVHAHAGRGLCRGCYNAERPPRTHRPEPKTRRPLPDALVPLRDAHAAAITCAEQVPREELRDVLEQLGLVGA